MAQELQGSGLHIFVSLKQLSPTCHVSLLAAPDTDHKHKFFLTCLSYLSDSLTNTLKIFGTRPIFTLRCFTAEWRINTNPISHIRKGIIDVSHTASNIPLGRSTTFLRDQIVPKLMRSIIRTERDRCRGIMIPIQIFASTNELK